MGSVTWSSYNILVQQSKCAGRRSPNSSLVLPCLRVAASMWIRYGKSKETTYVLLVSFGSPHSSNVREGYPLYTQHLRISNLTGSFLKRDKTEHGYENNDVC